MNVLQLRHGKGYLGCVSKEEEQQTGAQLNITKKATALQSLFFFTDFCFCQILYLTQTPSPPL